MKLKERLNPNNSALIVIDIQNDFCHPQGKRGSELSDIDSLIDRLSEFIDAAREQGVPIIFIRTEHDKSLDSEAWLARLGKNIDPDTYVPNCQPGSWGAEFYRLKPAEEDIVITKNRYSAFVGTNLNLVLQSLKRRSLLFTGVATNICVETSLRDAISHDYYAALVEDCCGTFSPEEHQSTIRNVEKQFGYVTTSAEVCGYWRNELQQQG